MYCLCCGKHLSDNMNDIVWHKACIKRFFGTDKMPKIDISDATLGALATESISKGYTVTGVQKKLSLHLMSEETSRLTLVNYPTGYILKPQVKEFEALPESEFLVMNMAEACGIRVVPHALIKVGTEFAYITKRIDREIENNWILKMLAMEDFCQLDLRLTQDKYRGSYERCVKIIQQYSSRAKLDLTELYLRLVFCYIVGNSDMHLKNFSLIETDEGSRKYVLSSAYDLLPINVIMPEDTEEFALTMNGKKARLRRRDFLLFAESCEIGEKTAEKMIKKVTSMKQHYLDMIEQSFLSERQKADFAELLMHRIETINK